MHSSSSPFVLHAPPISSSSFWLYLAKSTSYEHPHYVVFSNLTSTPFNPNILLSTLFLNTLSLCSSLNVWDQVSHPYRTTGIIIVLYSLIFMFLASRWEDKRFWTEW
jgi:hypothetical protein